MHSTITKSHWLHAQDCQAMAWYELRTAPSSPAEPDRFRMQQGQEVGLLARTLFPEGVVVSPTEGRTSAELTRELVQTGRAATLFEAAATAGPYTAKADILCREIGGWHLLEVKSSFSDSDKLSDYVSDLAYTVMVFRLAGLPILRASLVLLSRHFRHGMGAASLFERIDVTANVLPLAAEFGSAADAQARLLFNSAPPKAELRQACRDCSFFEERCLGVGIEHTVLELPNLHQKRLKRLAAEGVVQLRGVPDDLNLTECQIRVKNSALSGTPFIGRILRRRWTPSHGHATTLTSRPWRRRCRCTLDTGATSRCSPNLVFITGTRPPPGCATASISPTRPGIVNGNLRKR